MHHANDAAGSLQGHMVRGPEMRYVGQGTTLITFAVAHHRRYQRAGEWQKETSYVDVKS